MITSPVDPMARCRPNRRSVGDLVGGMKAADDGATTTGPQCWHAVQNQDPLNRWTTPRLTSQMAQISTVSGIDKPTARWPRSTARCCRCSRCKGGADRSRGDSARQSARLGDGRRGRRFEIASAADAVKVEILDGPGRTVDTCSSARPAPGATASSGNADGVPPTPDTALPVSAPLEPKRCGAQL